MKTINHRIIAITVFFMVISQLYSQQDDAKVNNPQAAFNIALRYTGIEADKEKAKQPLNEMVTLTTVIDTVTPFFHDKISGKTAWVVHIENITLNLTGRDPDVAAANPRDFDIYIDPITGNLLKIHSRLRGAEIDPKIEQPVEWAESGRQSEIYFGYPEKSPSLPFLMALNNARIGNLYKAKEIIAVYAMYFDRLISPDPIPAWSITARGLPPKKVFAPDTGKLFKICQWHEAENIIDATTGKYLNGGESAK